MKHRGIVMGTKGMVASAHTLISASGLKVLQNGGNAMVATMSNMAMGYVVAKEMIYDTIYESRPGSNRLEREAGYKMAEKLLEMGK